eukprot:4080351-Prymnesium_polylepis.1
MLRVCEICETRRTSAPTPFPNPVDAPQARVGQICGKVSILAADRLALPRSALRASTPSRTSAIAM